MASIEEYKAVPAAQHFVMLRDGAMASGCLFDPVLICETFIRGSNGLVQVHSTRTDLP
jgi:hypothetical protein